MSPCKDFENGEAPFDLSTVMKPAAKFHAACSKTFVVPSIADKIVDFDYYSIDGHSDGDQVFVGGYLDLDLCQQPGTTTVLYNDIKVTIVERGTSNIGFSSEMDEKFTIKIEIPKDWYVAQGELEMVSASK
jgi:hypothetical protein